MAVWMTMIGATLGALIGSEIARHRCSRDGKAFCFQPLWLYYSLSVAGIACVLFFAHTAEQALATPSKDAVLALIVSAVGAFVIMVVQTTIELNAAKRTVRMLQDNAGR